MIKIPEHYIELERVYAATLARNVRSLAVVSTYPGEGVSSIIMGLAHRCALAGRKTLLVDLNLHRPNLSKFANNCTLSESSHAIAPLLRVPIRYSDSEIFVVAAPTERRAIMKMREPGALESYIEGWLNEYDSVIFDTSPMSRNNSRNLPPEHIAGACEGAVLTVLAGKTTKTALSNTLSKINQAEVLLLGTIFNDQFNPTLRNELLREVKRLDKHFPRIANYCRNWLNRRNVLALEL